MEEVTANQHENYSLFTILAIIFPLIGLILGIVYLSKNNKIDKKLGEHALAFSILFGIIWTFVYVMFLTPSYEPGYYLNGY